MGHASRRRHSAAVCIGLGRAAVTCEGFSESAGANDPFVAANKALLGGAGSKTEYVPESRVM